MNFAQKLHQAAQKNSSFVCIGLDPEPELMPEVSIFEFNKAIIEATSDLVCAYKPNLAFYESLGIEGLIALEAIVKDSRSGSDHEILVAHHIPGNAQARSILNAAVLHQVLADILASLRDPIKHVA